MSLNVFFLVFTFAQIVDDEISEVEKAPKKNESGAKIEIEDDSTKDDFSHLQAESSGEIAEVCMYIHVLVIYFLYFEIG
jgi:hypothetical protein